MITSHEASYYVIDGRTVNHMRDETSNVHKISSRFGVMPKRLDMSKFFHRLSWFSCCSCDV